MTKTCPIDSLYNIQMAGTGHITLINPPNIYFKDGTSLFAQPPIGLSYLASSLLEAGFSVDLVDAVGDSLNQHRKETIGENSYWVQGLTFEQILARIESATDLIGFSCMFMHHWPHTRRLIEFLRPFFPGSLFVGGGEQISATWRHVLQTSELNVVGLGEGEEVIVDLAQNWCQKKAYKNVAGSAHIAHGVPVRMGERERIRDVDQIPWPAWDLIDLKSYQNKKLFLGPTNGVSMPVLATRGCPYKCSFCTSPGMWTTRWIPRSAADVVAEMKHYYQKYGVNDFQFVDLTTAVRKSWLIQFCASLETSGMNNISWQLPTGTRSEAIDYEVGQKMYATGCRVLVFAPESGSPKLLKLVKKQVNLETMLEAIKEVRKAGIMVDCNLICGMPQETFAMVLETWWYIIRLAFAGVDTIGYGGFRHVPGAEITESYICKGDIALGDEWFLGALNSISLYKRTVWSHPRFTPWQIGLFRFVGYVLFFTVSFSLHPGRLLRTLRNGVTGRQESRIDRIIYELRARRKVLAKVRQEKMNPVG